MKSAHVTGLRDTSKLVFKPSYLFNKKALQSNQLT